jgi:hypothetical protein
MQDKFCCESRCVRHERDLRIHHFGEEFMVALGEYLDLIDSLKRRWWDPGRPEALTLVLNTLPVKGRKMLIARLM